MLPSFDPNAPRDASVAAERRCDRCSGLSGQSPAGPSGGTDLCACSVIATEMPSADEHPAAKLVASAGASITSSRFGGGESDPWANITALRTARLASRSELLAVARELGRDLRTLRQAVTDCSKSCESVQRLLDEQEATDETLFNILGDVRDLKKEICRLVANQ